MFRIEPQRMFRILKLTGSFTSTWSPSQNAGRLEIILRDIGWVLGMLNAIFIMLALLYADYVHRHDVVTLMKPFCETATLLDVILALVLCRVKRTRFQGLMDEVEEFINNCNPEEEAIMQKYIDRSEISTVMAISNVGAAITFSFTPVFTDSEIPGDAMFPFSIKALYLKCPIYFLDVILLFQTALCVCVDFRIAMLMWYSAAKLELLGLRLQKATSKYEVKECAKEHQQILSFILEAQDVMETLLFKTNVTMGLTAIGATFSLLHREPINVQLQFICMVVASYQRLYVTALPADDLKETSVKLATWTYNVRWYEYPSEIAADIHIILLRSQKPVLISMGGLLPSLTLEYYAHFLYTISSYFMTMRQVIDD
ncbi:hypothetical protein KPH14_004788 [Odynerus spinipes]|uniref:Odorant receptor n=1 Tax=Odynerus spinipes TaxID=1348599 RepID=A0AAD9VQM7_9HYME|nr:hypothetical protein KPH14_004788 [Odynerus spinipes]